MIFSARYQKRISLFFLLVMSIQQLVPVAAYALTTGPTQPETKGFEPAGNSDMVDLFSGDFSYNIPLMDVGGYPVNIAYHSGASMDEEASWIGYGWNLNVGSLNRQLRGLPDDFDGTDLQERQMTVKDHVTVGGRISATLDLLGMPVKNIKKTGKKSKLDLTSLTISSGVKFDNYRGIGVELGANVGLGLTDYIAGDKNGSKEQDSTTKNSAAIFNVGLNLSSFDGASANISRAFQMGNLNKEEKTSLSKSIGFSYNSRSGLTGMTLTNSMRQVSDDNKRSSRNFDISSSFLSFNDQSYTPIIEHSTVNNSFTYSLNLGPEFFVAFAGLGVTGFSSKQKNAETIKKLPAYGYLHSEKGKDNPDALLDVNREKDIPYSSVIKYLPIPVPTYDLFSASSQDGGGQYRAHRGSSGVYFDPETEAKSTSYSVGLEVGAGTYFDVGADMYYQSIKSKTEKWKKRNNFLSKGDFQSGTSPDHELVYFKRVGEPVPVDQDYLKEQKNTSAISVALPKSITNGIEGAEASGLVDTKNARSQPINSLVRQKREVRNTAFNYLTAREAAHHGLDKSIRDYHPDSVLTGDCTSDVGVRSYGRTGGYRKGHHMSEVTITADDGKRTVYGLPVYNTYQEEVSFSSKPDLTKRKKGLISYVDGRDNSLNNKNGLENYYSKEITPAYAASYLLTGILSADYVDKTGNGITDDDLGTAVKFNYSKLNQPYKWRTPYGGSQDIANYNEGFLSDATDDKANYVYGEKEVWYLHSIESKTMVAHFITEDRNDGLGVLDSRGGVNTSVRLKRLKEIRLYSKSALRETNNDASKTTPIKVVHFVHNYSICKGLPNSVDNGGKLTLEKVYFTFGNNNKGSLYPYQFGYDTSYTNFYDHRQYDRWGNFKDADSNWNGLNNSEFPYVLQNKPLTDRFGSLWQMNNIKLPSGGYIHVAYESDDYGYVQDKIATQMCMVKGINSLQNEDGLIQSENILVTLPVPVYARDLKEKYFKNLDKLYFKALLDLDGLGHKEFVPGYADIKSFAAAEFDGTNKVTTVKIELQKVGGINPIARTGWQFLRMNLPKYAYPGSDNLESDESNITKSIKALVTAYQSISELFKGFEKRARNKGFSDRMDVSRSWVRLNAPERQKLGGGARVRRIDITDNWAQMSGVAGARSATYSQLYTYTIADDKGTLTSSGVAAYEPQLGSDENPFHQPVSYKQKQFLGIDNYFYIEQPFCESYFPAANVGYSKVTVKSIGAGDEETVNRTGTTSSQFYTAKDFPTKVEVTRLDERIPASNKISKLIGAVSLDMIGLSQGYAVELNDMHGKPRSVQVLNKANQEISGVEYYYKTANENTEKKDLRNDVKVISNTGYVKDGVVGMDVEVYTDMRQQTTDNIGFSAKISGGSGAILFFPLPFFFPGIGANYEKRSYRASSTVKVINRFAIPYKVKKTQDGSSITTENMLWDEETGNVLLTKTQNEFDDPVFSFAYPAHWAYDRMGQAYRNAGMVLTSFSAPDSTISLNNPYYNFLVPGDELVDIDSGNKFWVIQPASSAQKSVIDKNGQIQPVSNLTLRLIRSGRRNMANATVGTIVSLNNPIVGDHLDISALSKVLDAKATIFNEEWSMPMSCSTCPDGYNRSKDGTTCIKETPVIPDESCFTICGGDQSEVYSASGTIIYEPGYDPQGRGIRDTLLKSPFWRDTCKILVQQSSSKSNSFYGDSSASIATQSITAKSSVTGTACDMFPGARNSILCGPLNRTSIWTCRQDRSPLNQWIGFKRSINVPNKNTYYLGVASDNDFKVTVDYNKILESISDTNYNFYYWHIYPITLTEGPHTINIEARNNGNKAAFGAEIYNNTKEEIIKATSYAALTLLFSTKDVIGQQFDLGRRLTCPVGYELNTSDSPYTCQKSVPAASNVINPYFTGMLGNWRPQSQYVYQVNRENIISNAGQTGSTNIRKAGAYSLFNPFWSYPVNVGASTSGWVANILGDPRWIAGNQITHYNAKGSEVENKDALGHYSSALFGYAESLPTAVASNSRYREIAYDGFEDYHFSLGCTQADSCVVDHFSFRKSLSSSVALSAQKAHSGKYSLLLNDSASISKSVFDSTLNGNLSSFQLYQYMLQSNEMSKGFSPIPGKKYILSFWTYDNSPRDPSTAVQATVNGKALLNLSSKWPVVEGWKRVEVPFILLQGAASFNLTLSSGGSPVYIDDLRIHPYDGQMKSFAYDAGSQRLMAEMDENNFATFYEYDDEGILLRVKKETERGIMTIKETRSSTRII